jgi:hypothetical protein
MGVDWPHPYHGSAAKRRAIRRSRRSQRIVDAAVMGSVTRLQEAGHRVERAAHRIEHWSPLQHGGVVEMPPIRVGLR